MSPVLEETLVELTIVAQVGPQTSVTPGIQARGNMDHLANLGNSSGTDNPDFRGQHH